MKKHILLISNLIIVFAIVTGFIAIVARDTVTYQNLAENHLENIVNLADINISKNIENSMTKPVMVSKTMANDEFLKKWLSQESSNSKNSAYLEQLYRYLKAYQDKYGYTTVFCVSAQSGNYYYQNGLNKRISHNDNHDIWYYNFIKSGHEYDLQIDKDQSNGNNVTVFVNFRMVGDDGRLLGVIGVGLKVSSIEETIHSYEKDYGLSVYIINVGSSKNSFTGDTDIFIKKAKLPEHTGIKENIEMSKSDTSKIQWFTSGDTRKCLIIKYNDTLEWYLVLEKDTDSIYRALQQGIKGNIIFMLISLVICVLVTTIVFTSYNRHIISMENTDDLTGLSNRKLFSKQYPTFLRRHRGGKNTMFMFDIDHFKEINDSYGHMLGNAILSMVGKELKQIINGYGAAARWGGDEFIGVLAAKPEEAEQILSRLMNTLNNAETDSCYRVTISVGIAEIDGKLNAEQMINKVDKALYRSKKDGRNRITVVAK